MAEKGDALMIDDVRIRRVSVEFLRPGPAHNQLLSPFTQYLAVCNDAGAAVVTVPYEHRVFERRLKELRYETGDQNDRLAMLHEIGRDMGRILEAVPGFTGALANDASGATLVHVRLTLSAAELALLPFELAEVPVGSAGTAVSIHAVSCDGDGPRGQRHGSGGGRGHASGPAGRDQRGAALGNWSGFGRLHCRRPPPRAPYAYSAQCSEPPRAAGV